MDYEPGRRMIPRVLEIRARVIREVVRTRVQKAGQRCENKADEGRQRGGAENLPFGQSRLPAAEASAPVSAFIDGVGAVQSQTIPE